jgi:hypothetical protein
MQLIIHYFPTKCDTFPRWVMLMKDHPPMKNVEKPAKNVEL